MRRLGIRYPVAHDNDYATWNAFQNQYWPAKYLIDRRGHLRYYHFGEGEYDTVEERIRMLLGESAAMLPVANRLSDRTPRTPLTPETLPRLRTARALRSARQLDSDQIGSPTTSFRNGSCAGRARIRRDAGESGRSRSSRGSARGSGCAFTARKVFLVLGGEGNVRVLLDGKEQRVVRVNGSRLYTLLSLPKCGRACSSCASTPASGATRSRSARTEGHRRTRSRRRSRARARAGTA